MLETDMTLSDLVEKMSTLLDNGMTLKGALLNGFRIYNHLDEPEFTFEEAETIIHDMYEGDKSIAYDDDGEPAIFDDDETEEEYQEKDMLNGITELLDDEDIRILHDRGKE